MLLPTTTAAKPSIPITKPTTKCPTAASTAFAKSITY
jgi:hypothetical protein